MGQEARQHARMVKKAQEMEKRRLQEAAAAAGSSRVGAAAADSERATAIATLLDPAGAPAPPPGVRVSTFADMDVGSQWFAAGRHVPPELLRACIASVGGGAAARLSLAEMMALGFRGLPLRPRRGLARRRTPGACRTARDENPLCKTLQFVDFAIDHQFTARLLHLSRVINLLIRENAASRAH